MPTVQRPFSPAPKAQPEFAVHTPDRTRTISEPTRDSLRPGTERDHFPLRPGVASLQRWLDLNA